MWYSTPANFCDAARYSMGAQVSMTLRQVRRGVPANPSADTLFAVQLYGLFSLMLLSVANWKPSCVDSKTTKRDGRGDRRAQDAAGELRGGATAPLFSWPNRTPRAPRNPLTGGAP
jgi:hypothetical protein